MFTFPCSSRKQSARRSLAPSSRQGKPRQPARARLSVELLEERLVPSTMMVKDINPHLLSSSPTALVALDGKVYFEANEGSDSAFGGAVNGLYESDGTAANTVGIAPGLTNVQGLTVFNNTLYFFAEDSSTQQEGLYKSDGLSAPTLVVALATNSLTGQPGINGFDYFTQLGGYLYFTTSGSNQQTGQSMESLYRTDGVTAPAQVFSIATSAGFSQTDIANLTLSGNYLYFSLTTGGFASTSALYSVKADGSDGAPTLLADNLTSVSNLTAADGYLYFTTGFSSSPQILYQTAGNTAPIQVANNLTEVSDLVAVSGHLFFTAEVAGPLPSTQLYSYQEDGSAGGPTQLTDSQTDVVVKPVAFNGRLYFGLSEQGNSADRVYSSDGTVAGTAALPGSPMDVVNTNLTPFDGWLYFNDIDAGLYRTDGSTATLVAAEAGTSTKTANASLREYTVLLATGSHLYMTSAATDSSNTVTISDTSR